MVVIHGFDPNVFPFFLHLLFLFMFVFPVQYAARTTTEFSKKPRSVYTFQTINDNVILSPLPFCVVCLPSYFL